MKFVEVSFSLEAEKEMLRCRPGDWEHAKRVVNWVKEIGKGNKYLSIVVATAYIHDIGWRNVLPDNNQKLTKDQLLKYEPVANMNSEKFVSDFLRTFGFSGNDIKLALELVAAADKHESSNNVEAIIVDADNLSKTSIDHFKEKYKKESWMDMYKFLEEEFPTRIKTQKGKQLAPKLLNRLRSDIQAELRPQVLISCKPRNQG